MAKDFRFKLDRFAKGFGETFGPAFQQSQKQGAESAQKRLEAAIEADKQERSLQKFDSLKQQGAFGDDPNVSSIARAILESGGTLKDSLSFAVKAGEKKEATETPQEKRVAKAVTGGIRPKDLNDDGVIDDFEIGEAQVEADFQSKQLAPGTAEFVRLEDAKADDFEKRAKDYRQAEQAMQRVSDSAKDPSAAGDLALIFNYMKILDPNSVVRESEFRTADEARAWLSESETLGFRIPASIKQAIQKLDTGKRLIPEQRADFLDRANRLFTGQRELHRGRQVQFSQLAKRRGFNSRNIITDLPDFDKITAEDLKGMSKREKLLLKELMVLEQGGE